MPRIIESLEVPVPPSRYGFEAIPFEDGQVRIFARGSAGQVKAGEADFDVKPDSFRNSLITWIKRNTELKLKTVMSKDEHGVECVGVQELEAFQRDEAARKAEKEAKKAQADAARKAKDAEAPSKAEETPAALKAA